MAASQCREFQCYLQRLHEFPDFDWFGEIAEESGLQSLLDVAKHGDCTEGDYRDMRGYRVFAKDFEGFDAANAGKIDVHEDHIRLFGACQLNALKSVSGSQRGDIGIARDELL